MSRLPRGKAWIQAEGNKGTANPGKMVKEYDRRTIKNSKQDNERNRNITR